jgi:hypothetical protein
MPPPDFGYTFPESNILFSPCLTLDACAHAWRLKSPILVRNVCLTLGYARLLIGWRNYKVFDNLQVPVKSTSVKHSVKPKHKRQAGTKALGFGTTNKNNISPFS